MSEYQYYEFKAVDQPLTPEQMRELRLLSTRAIITRNSFSNTYHYGDFRGNPRELMESYFDAHVYVSNFGTVTFMLRLPRNVLPEDILARYAAAAGLEWRVTNANTILEWRLDEDPRDEWMDGEGWMDQLLPIRDELARGDYRSLYIGWLSSIAAESPNEEDEEEDDFDEENDFNDGLDEENDETDGANHMEPPVPAGLKSLTAAQIALTEFLGVDSDLIAAAADASPDVQERGASDQSVAEWVARLPEREVRAILVRLLHGEGLRIQAELQSQYHRACNEFTANSRPDAGGSGRRTAADLLAIAVRTAEERDRKNSEERERKRRTHLAELAARFADLWVSVSALAEEQKASSYDKVCVLLVDMRDAYIQAGRRSEFDTEFARFLGQYSRRTALMRRLQEAKLMS